MGGGGVGDVEGTGGRMRLWKLLRAFSQKSCLVRFLHPDCSGAGGAVGGGSGGGGGTCDIALR